MTVSQTEWNRYWETKFLLMSLTAMADYSVICQHYDFMFCVSAKYTSWNSNPWYNSISTWGCGGTSRSWERKTNELD